MNRAKLESRISTDLAAYWLEIGHRQRARAACFSRLASSLLAHGAPAVLLREVQRAGSDTLGHATRAFELASDYAGRELHPAPEPLMGRLRLPTRAAISELLHELCVGETLTGVEAYYCAETTREPAPRMALSALASDALRHAELGWKCLRYLLAVAPPADREFAVDSLRRALIEARYGEDAEGSESPGPQREELEAHGKLCPSRRALLRNDTIERLLMPFLAKLRGGHSVAGTRGL